MLFARSPSFDSDTAFPRNIAKRSMAANGRVKNTSIIQFSVNIHQTNTKNPTPMWTTLRTSRRDPRRSRTSAAPSDTAMMPYTSARPM